MSHQPVGNDPGRDDGGILTAPQPQPQGVVVPGGILVVDDDGSVLFLLQRLLEHQGFRVWSARSGREAIDLYRRHRDGIAVVLLDVRMPGLDGPQTLAVLQKEDPGVLACFMSADLGDYDPEQLLRSGAQHVFPKPFPLDELVGVLRLLASGVPADFSSGIQG
jgi:CheY-like chemotaxis protein